MGDFETAKDKCLEKKFKELPPPQAKALLQHTDWSISEIAYALGFEYPTYFNNFFKKITGTNPKSFRLTGV